MSGAAGDVRFQENDAKRTRPIDGRRGLDGRCPNAPTRRDTRRERRGSASPSIPQSGRHAAAGGRPVPFHVGADTPALIPAGRDVISTSPEGGEYLDVELWGDPEAPEIAPFGDRRGLARSAHALRRELISAARDGTSIEVLVAEPRTAAFDREPGREGTWMTPRRPHTIETVIEERLAERPSVSEIARALGLSLGFLIRAFRAATGRGLHEHLIDRRVARARAALPDRERGPADIARALGLSSHARMTERFRRRLGASPETIRRSME